MKRMGLFAILLLALGGLTRGSVAAPVVVSTLSSWDGSASIGDFGAAGFSGWGQFLQAPTGTNRMLDFTLVLGDALNGANTTPVPVEFQAHLVQYDPITRRVLGPDLYTSAVITVPLTSVPQFSLYKFSMDVVVNAGDTYMMFLFANNYTLQIPNDSRLRLTTASTDLAGGSYNIPMFADGDLASMYSGQWRQTAGPDLAFSATFDNRPTTAVPEPAGLLLLAAAGSGGVWVSRRRARTCEGRTG